MRFSDWGKFGKLNLDGDVVTIRTQKTGTNVVIPILPKVRELILKYQGKLPNVKENQVFNRDLKDIGKLAEIDEMQIQLISKGGKRIEKSVPKHDLITTHTARRSFATNMYNKGIPINHIMKVTGHKTETQFLKYIKNTPTDAAKSILAVFNVT